MRKCPMPGQEKHMPKATVKFSHMIQDSQDYGSNDEHMVSHVFFDLTVGDKRYPGVHAIVKQTVGASFESDPLEVSPPVGYKGPMNFDAFRKAVERYCRSSVGSTASGMRSSGGAKNIRLRDNRFTKQATESFDI